MNNDNVQSLRRLFNIITVLGFVAFSGCSHAPEKKEEAVEPAPETAPVAEEPTPAPAEVAPPQQPVTPIVLAPNHPDRYVVVKGDTLWDIASRFLRDPWLWPEVWQGNPHVSNPHLIFPGDVLMIRMVNGRPVMEVARGPVAASAGVTEAPVERPSPVPTDASGRPLSVVRLSPQVREIELEKAIPTIPMDAIKQFLERSAVIEDGESMPYLLAFADQHISGGMGYRFYARRIKDQDQIKYTVVRLGKEYRDPDSGEFLGNEALYVGDAELKKGGDPATLTLIKAKREALPKDRLIPGEPESFNYSFMPHAPAKNTKGRVVSVFDAVNQIGQHQVVVLNLGKRNGIEPGHVMAVFQDSPKVDDPVRGGKVKLPNERAGTVIVFRTFDKVSYALVTGAVRTIHLNDWVQNP